MSKLHEFFQYDAVHWDGAQILVDLAQVMAARPGPVQNTTDLYLAHFGWITVSTPYPRVRELLLKS